MCVFCVCLCASVCARGRGVFFLAGGRGKIRIICRAVGRGPKRAKNYKKIKTKHKTVICQHKYKALEKK